MFLVAKQRIPLGTEQKVIECNHVRNIDRLVALGAVYGLPLSFGRCDIFSLTILADHVVAIEKTDRLAQQQNNDAGRDYDRKYRTGNER